MITKSQLSKIELRPSWDQYFMNLVDVIKTRSTCLRRNIGCVIVKDRRILCTGYNGAPSGLPHCLDPAIGCLREKKNIPSGQNRELCRANHAEENAILQAAKFGIAIEGGTLYVSVCPCNMCAKMIINVGIKRVVYSGSYPDPDTKKYFDQAGIIYENIA